MAINNSTELEECLSSLTELIQYLQACHRWSEYKAFLQGSSQCYQVLTAQAVGEQGRPRFQVSKFQLEYSESLAFKWTEEGAPKYFTFFYPANTTTPTHFLFLDSKLITYSGLHILMAS